MIYSDFQDIRLSRLGFGTMRLPVLDGGVIDEAQVDEMVAYCFEHGINYFDTAYPYHGGKSETVIGRALKKYPRDSYYLASKYPGHVLYDEYIPSEIFEEQLEKCQVDYFDFYLLHNVYENSMATYEDPKWGIMDYFIEQKKLGKIKHLGFSSHGMPEMLEDFLARYGSEMEFCQIQLNYLDWTLQDADCKVEILNKYNIPIWVMEPIRGGKLAQLSEAQEAKLSSLTPGRSDASWALRWVREVPGVAVVLSGMSNLDQMKDNVATFEDETPLAEAEKAALLEVAEDLKDSVPCTACRYCCDGCPQQLDIPYLIKSYNDLKVQAANTVPMQFDAIDREKWPTACIGCGACAAICPQKIDIPHVMELFADALAKAPSWKETSRIRNEERKAAKAAREAK